MIRSNSAWNLRFNNYCARSKLLYGCGMHEAKFSDYIRYNQIADSQCRFGPGRPSDTHRRYAKVERSGYVQVRHRPKGQQSAKLRRRKGHGSSMTMANAKVEKAGFEHDHGE